MAYTKQTWVNGSGGATPINATRLNYIETGIETAAATADAASAGGGIVKNQPDLVITSPATEDVVAIEVQDDQSATGTWPNRLEWFFKPFGAARRLVQWVNEYGELRLIPAKDNTVALRVFAKDNTADANHTGPVFEVNRTRSPFGDRETVFGVEGDGTVTALGNVSAPNIGAPVFMLAEGAAEPAGIPNDALIVRYTP